jgi:uncharacterized membrane protein
MSQAKRTTAAGNEQRLQLEQELVDAMKHPVDQNIETIARIHKHMENEIDQHQRTIESVTAFLGRPHFLYIILTIVTLWIVANTFLVIVGLRAFDPVPFTWLLEAINLSSLLMTTMILITQNRQNGAAEQRRHLELQFEMLIEQKVTKVISLLEELRRDLPEVQKRLDPDVEVMKQPVDPHEVLTTLDQRLQENDKET